MGFFDFLRGPDIDAGLAQCQETPGALLLDVRTLLPGDEDVIAAALSRWKGEEP